MMIVLVCGDRNWTDRATIEQVLAQLPANTVIMHGAARGADRLAGEVAKARGLEVIAVPAEWDRYGRSAGAIRNHRMLIEGRPARVMAFHDNLAASRGTRHMVEIARAAGIEVQIYGSHREDSSQGRSETLQNGTTRAD